ncbi:MAG: hypothetical protein AVDCRST_MAG67-3195, partial [uncultured Solirubrobacteraceae bacterium]
AEAQRPAEEDERACPDHIQPDAPPARSICHRCLYCPGRGPSWFEARRRV